MKIKKIITALFVLFLNSISLFAQTTPVSQGMDMETYSQIAGLAAILLVFVMFILIFVFSSEKYKYNYNENRVHVSLFKRFRQAITKSVPIEQEGDIMLEHDFDGIRELNNTVPPWFNALFYGSIVIAIIYLVNYHVIGSGNVMYDEYNTEVTKAQMIRNELIRTGAFINEENVTLLRDNVSLENGKKTFTNNCIPCHGPDAGGTVGPNLTDDYWIHGAGIKNIFKTIKYGVPAKGMITWQTMLNPKQIQEVACYVISLHGTKPLIGKAPEGTIYIESDSVKTPSDSTKIAKK